MAEERDPVRRRQAAAGVPWRDLGFVSFFLAAALGPIISIVLRFVPGHLERAGCSPALVGEVMAASTLGAVLVLPLAGWLANHHMRAMLIAGAAIQGVGLCCVGLASASPVGIAASVAVMSVGTGLLDVGVLAGLIVLTPAPRRSQLLAYYFAYISLARNVIGSSLAEAVLSAWSFAALCYALAAAAAAHLAYRALTDAPCPREAEVAATRGEFLRDLSRPRTLLLLLVFVLLAVHYSAVESFITALVARRELGGVTPFFTVYFVVLFGGRAVGGHLVERLGRGPVTVFSALVLLAVGGGLAEVGEPLTLFALGAGTGIGHLLLWPALYSTFYSKVRGPGMVSAALSAALALAAFIAELGLGELASRAGYRALYWGAGGAALTAAALALPLSRWMSSPESDARS